MLSGESPLDGDSKRDGVGVAVSVEEGREVFHQLLLPALYTNE